MSLASDAPPLAVIGAGIVGCALALALDHAGVPVVLLDQGPAPGPESDPRRGVALAPAGDVWTSGRMIESLTFGAIPVVDETTTKEELRGEVAADDVEEETEGSSFGLDLEMRTENVRRVNRRSPHRVFLE